MATPHRSILLRFGGPPIKQNWAKPIDSFLGIVHIWWNSKSSDLRRINYCYLVGLIFRGEFRIIFTNKHGLEKIPRTPYCPKNLHVKNEVILWPLTSSKIIVLVAQPILTDGGPPAWAVDKRAELGWPSSRGKG